MAADARLSFNIKQTGYLRPTATRLRTTNHRPMNHQTNVFHDIVYNTILYKSSNEFFFVIDLNPNLISYYTSIDN